MRGRLLSLVLCLWLGVTPAVRGAQIVFQSWVDPLHVTLADSLKLTLRISSSEMLPHLPAPEIDLRDFHARGPEIGTVASRHALDPQQAVTFVRDLVYTLYPRRTGKLLLGPARLTLNGREYETKAVAVQVSAGGTVAVSGARRVLSRAPGPTLDELIFVRASIQPPWAYVGQPVRVDYELWRRVPVDNVGFETVPPFAGFWAKELFVAQSLQDRRQLQDGTAFQVAPLRQLVLFPTRPGAQKIVPLVVSCDIVPHRGLRGSGLDPLFAAPLIGGSRRAVLVRSDSLHLDVRPLPETGRPPDFQGAVGEFSLEVSAAPEQLMVGDPLTLRVVIDGWGNLDALMAPALDVPASLKCYAPEKRLEERMAGERVGGRCTFEYILIPEVRGTVDIAPVRFPYFDPQTGRYTVLKSQPVRIVSTGDSVVPPAEEFGMGRRDIQPVGADIRYIKPDVAELGRGGQLHRSSLFWSFLAALPVAFQMIYLYQRHQRRLQGDVAYARRRRARNEAERRLDRSRALLAGGTAREFHREIQRALLAFLGDRLNLAPAGLSRERRAQVLAAHDVPRELAQELEEILGRCDLVRFAAVSSSAAAMEDLRERAQQCIRQLARVIR